MWTRDGKEVIEVFGTDQNGNNYVFTFWHRASMRCRYDKNTRA